MPSILTKQEAEREDILDISQNGQLDSLGSLKARITEGVFKASLGKRQIPIEVMYQGDGANLPEYYLYQAERSILQTYADEMASLIADRSSIIELGAGSLEKTRVADGINYYALDINRNALVESLASLPVLKKIKCHGLFGTYNDGLHHVAKLQRRSDVEKVPRVFVWLGSSIGNLTVEGAVAMVKSIADVMVDGDMILIGQAVFDMSKFVYSAQVNHLEGRNECCCMASEAVELNYQGETVRMERGERILVVPSYKYADEQVVDMVKATGCLEVVRRFGTPDDAEIHYGVWMWRKTARSTMSSK
ncbi:hypothetical protein BGZ90_002934 [Linnemannia elongata]|nr:hypothetical protein BGZ90_002934 [Linnemannia elongata]